MKFAAIIVASLAAATAVGGAAQAKASDADYLRANRCAGLASAQTLGEIDAAALEAFVQAEGRTRTMVVLDKGKQERERAVREARTTNDQRIARLSAELDGPCRALVGAVSAGGPQG